jgi:hypothetical protein
MQLFRARFVSRGDYFRARFFVASGFCFSFSFVVSNYPPEALAPSEPLSRVSYDWRSHEEGIKCAFLQESAMVLLVSASVLLTSVSNSLLLFLRRLTLATKSIAARVARLHRHHRPHHRLHRRLSLPLPPSPSPPASPPPSPPLLPSASPPASPPPSPDDCRIATSAAFSIAARIAASIAR